MTTPQIANVPAPAQDKSISVAMATYNGSNYLPVQLESIRTQTVTPFELVVTDDGSTDSTLLILEEFAGTAPFPVRVFRNEKNLGYADNFIRAASLCTGTLIAFCDQDDFWLSNKLEVCSAPFEDPEVRLCVHSGGLWTGVLQLSSRCPDYAKDEKAKARELYPLQGTFGFAMVIRRDLLSIADNQNRFSTESNGKPTPHDRWFWLLGSLFGSVVLLSEVLTLYRQHGANQFGGMTMSTGAMMRSTLDSRDFSIAAADETRCAEYLSDLAKKTSQRWRRDAEAGVDFLNTCAHLNRERSALYVGKSLGSRVRSFISLWRSGAYTHDRFRCKPFGHDSFRSPYRAAMKDLLFGVMRLLRRA